MALVIQSSKIITDLMLQVVGAEAVYATAKNAETGEVTVTTTPLAMQDIVSNGRDWLEKGGDQNVMYKALFDIIGDYIIQDRILPRMNEYMITENPMYGQAIEKIYYEPIDAQDNPSFKSTYDSATDDPFKISMVEIKVKLFSKFTTWEVPFTIVPEYTLKSAFVNEGTLTRYIAGIWQCAENSMTMKLDACAEMARMAWIGHKVIYAKSTGAEGVHVVHLLTEYKSLDGVPESASTLTSTSARRDKDFITYAVQRMSVIYDQLTPINQIFNTEQYKRFSPDGDKNFVMLSNFASDIDYNLYSSTFHDTYMKLPTFHRVPYWQGLGETGSWDDVSAVNITVEDLTAGDLTATENVQLSNIVALITDRDAMGVTLYNRHTTSHYNGHNEKTNYWMKADVGSFADMSEQGVLFVLD